MQHRSTAQQLVLGGLQEGSGEAEEHPAVGAAWEKGCTTVWETGGHMLGSSLSVSSIDGSRGEDPQLPLGKQESAHRESTTSRVIEHVAAGDLMQKGCQYSLILKKSRAFMQRNSWGVI